MSFGIVEVITLLLGLTGFGITADPQAPTADRALAYAMADADVAVHVDLASIVPGNYKLLGQLADQPQIKASPELSAAVRRAVGEVEGARGMAKMATGIDLASDINDATAFVQIPAHGEPNFVVAVHGKLTPALLDKIAGMTGGATAAVDHGKLLEMNGQPALGFTRDGVLLAGTPGLVRDRLADGWKPPSHDAASSLGAFADAINGKPVFAVSLTLSSEARDKVVHELGSKANFAIDLIKHHKAATFSLLRDGIAWTWIDHSKPGLDSMEQVSSGLLDVLRAAQIAPRGLAKIAFGSIDSYAGTDPQIDALIQHKADLEKLIDVYGGDGTFKVKIDKDVRALRLNVRATGGKLSDVLPVGILLPAAVFGYLSTQEKKATTQIAEPPPPPPSARPTGQPVPRPSVPKPPVKKP